ncbi:MAG: saccharopine dehydrogenase [Polyangiaceae bacterium]|nr:saccharopine dehydrogenase [Polyangiaceae bacterium]
MIYGANGYSGRLCAELAVSRGLRPILAGRRPERIEPLAKRLGLPWRSFALDEPRGVEDGLAGVRVVLHTAGPFSGTSQPMVDGCLAARCHYLDIAGEIPVLEALHARDAEAAAAGVCLVSGMGFDVVPSDCLAAMLATALPDATTLELAFYFGGGQSQGTLKTVVEALPAGGTARIDGEIRDVPTGWKARDVAFGDRTRSCVSLPWGDVATAFWSTNIPNVTVYMAVPRAMLRAFRLVEPVRGALAYEPVQRALKGLIERAVRNPDESAREGSRAEVWGEVTNAAGERRSGLITTPNGYSLTADAAVQGVARLLAGGMARTGALTPSRAFGADFVRTLSGVAVKLGG